MAEAEQAALPNEEAAAAEEEPSAKPVSDAPKQDLAATAGSLEVDRALMSAESVPQSPSKKGQKPLSLLGANLAKKPTVGASPASPTSGDKPARPIVDRYAAEVRAADQNRKLGYLPMQKQINFTPAGLDIARDMRAELHDMTKSMGGAHLVSQGIGWDAMLGTDHFQKRLQFLHEHARTGHFIEQYGAEGMYEGEFMHGMRHGKGRYEFREEVYDGDWKWDHRHGYGTLNCGDGTTIKGEWQNGKMHGFGTVVDQKGTVVYTGEFQDGKRHGLGRQVFDGGDMYDGVWQNGRLHDRGVYYFTNGDRLYGMWREGIYDGVGVFHYADGSISRREYRDGLLMSVQDYEHASQRFGKTLTRDGMQKHTRDRDFPKEVFLLNSV